MEENGDGKKMEFDVLGLMQLNRLVVVGKFFRGEAMKKLLLVVLAAILISCGIASAELSGWSYKRPITIDNTQNNNDLTDYQILVVMDTKSLIDQGKMRSDCGDIRFEDGGVLLSYWIESGCGTTNTRIWVKVPTFQQIQ